MRPTWKGTISFGLVSITVSLYPATQREELKFRLLRASDLSRVNYKCVTKPTTVAFDLDPGAPANIIDCCKVALRLNAMLGKMKLKCFPKTSGSKGLQVYVPLNTPASYERTKEFARQVAEALEEQTPHLVVSRMAKNLRKGKVFVDWSQNDDHKTTVNVYSLRAKEVPAVSTPLAWKEVEAAVKRGEKSDLAFTPDEVVGRVKKQGDLFLPVLKLKQKLPAIPHH